MGTLYAKLAAALILIIGTVGVCTVMISQSSMKLYYEELTQKLSEPIAMYVTDRYRMIGPGVDAAQAIKDVARIAMIVNPAAEVYLLDKQGTVIAHAFSDHEIKRGQVDLRPIQAFLQGSKKMPLRGDDPRNPGQRKIFSVTETVDDNGLSGYLYVILGGERFDQLSGSLKNSYIRITSLWGIVIILFGGLVIGLLIFHLLIKRLSRLRRQMDEFAGLNFRSANLPIDPQRDADEIDVLVGTFTNMSKTILQQVDQLKETDRLRRELISNVSHDLRTPLTLLQGYMETLLIKGDQLDIEECRQYSKNAKKSIDRLARLITDLFELSKLETGNTTPRIEAFMIGELLHDTVQEFQFHAREKNIHVEVEYVDKNLMVYADIGLIQRVFENLIRNAISYTPENGVVKLRFWAGDDEAIISVEDTGRGISEYDMRYIFDRFYQADNTSTADTESSGLGLSIVKKILDLHHSEINVESSINQGTKFRFTLPIHTM